MALKISPGKLKKILKLEAKFNPETGRYAHKYEQIGKLAGGISKERVRQILEKEGIARKPEYMEFSGGTRLRIFTPTSLAKKIAREEYLRKRRRIKPKVRFGGMRVRR